MESKSYIEIIVQYLACGEFFFMEDRIMLLLHLLVRVAGRPNKCLATDKIIRKGTTTNFISSPSGKLTFGIGGGHYYLAYTSHTAPPHSTLDLEYIYLLYNDKPYWFSHLSNN